MEVDIKKFLDQIVNLHRISNLTVKCNKIRRNTKGAGNEEYI
jgi:hypothetical protein